MELVYGVLRYRYTLDWVLKEFLKKPSGLSGRTMNNLRLAVYQILHMRVPERAAVHEAVDIEKERGRPALVNGVLRNLLRNLGTVRSRLGRLKEANGAHHIALSTSHPEWLIRRWLERLGEAETRELAEANNLIPPLTLRVNTLIATVDEILRIFADAGIEAELTAFSPDGLKLREFRTFSGLPSRDALVVQDEASQLITILLDPQPGERILDACAAPGGKTTHIAQFMKDSGEITAVESEERRIPQLQENISRLGLQSIRTIHGDIVELADNAYALGGSEQRWFDRILLDAPCSSLGVIRRNPDIKYRHTGKDLRRMQEIQLTLLRSASGLLRPGGTMVYSVCSTEPEEGEDVIKAFLKVSEEFYIIDRPISLLRGFMKQGFFRTYPHRFDMDGFFGVRLCRKA